VGAVLAGLIGAVFLPQPVTDASEMASKSAVPTRLVKKNCDFVDRNGVIVFSCILRSMVLPKWIIFGEGVPNEVPVRRACGAYFQLQLGISAPGPVSGRCCVPSASMVQIRV